MTPSSVAALALPLAAALVAALSRGFYRLPAEDGGSTPRPWWLLPTLPVLWYLFAALHRQNPLTLALLLCWVTVLAVLAAIDFDVHRLPDAIQLPFLIVLVPASITVGLLEHGPTDALRALLGAAAAGAAYFVLFLLGRGALGFGDVKLALILGCVLGLFGWGTVVVGALLGPVIAAMYAIPALLLGRRRRTDHMPLGPSLILGAVLATLPAGL